MRTDENDQLTKRFEKMLEITVARAKKVCVIGLGTVGSPTASHIAKNGYEVFGFDKDDTKVKTVKDIKAFSEWSRIPKAEVYVVCVGTGWKDGRPDMTSVYDACSRISKVCTKDLLLCIESTVSVGTCRAVSKMFDQVSLVYVPHRYWSENTEEHGVVQTRVIGALDTNSLSRGREFYESLGINLHSVSSLEVAEMIKIAENTYRFTQISFAEELSRICNKLSIPFKEVREGANTKWNINILEAREGIEGDCLPKDIRYLSYLCNDASLLKGAIKADNLYKIFIKRKSGLETR